MFIIARHQENWPLECYPWQQQRGTQLNYARVQESRQLRALFFLFVFCLFVGDEKAPSHLRKGCDPAQTHSNDNEIQHVLTLLLVAHRWFRPQRTLSRKKRKMQNFQKIWHVFMAENQRFLTDPFGNDKKKKKKLQNGKISGTGKQITELCQELSDATETRAKP